MTAASFEYMQRKNLINHIRKNIEPLLWNSGFVDNTFDVISKGAKSRPLKLFAFKKPKKLRNGFIVKEYEGFTMRGVITDGYGHGIVITEYPAIPIEDLEKLLKVTNSIANEHRLKNADDVDTIPPSAKSAMVSK